MTIRAITTGGCPDIHSVICLEVVLKSGKNHSFFLDWGRAMWDKEYWYKFADYAWLHQRVAQENGDDYNYFTDIDEVEYRLFRFLSNAEIAGERVEVDPDHKGKFIVDHFEGAEFFDHWGEYITIREKEDKKVNKKLQEMLKEVKKAFPDVSIHITCAEGSGYPVTNKNWWWQKIQ